MSTTPDPIKPKKTGAQRQNEYRQRLAAKGRVELRGIYAYMEDRDKIREFAARLTIERQSNAEQAARELSDPR